MKNFILLPILLLTCAAWAADPSTNASSFAPNWTDLASVNSGYTFLQQSNGTVIPSVSGQQGLGIYSGTALSNDQYSQLQFVAHVDGSLSSTGPCVRMSATGDGVCYLADIGQLYLLAGGGGIGDISSSCPIPASGDVIQLSVVGSTYTCSDLTTGASSSTQNGQYSGGQPGFIVDQRPSAVYAVAQVQADCIPSCSGQPVTLTNSTAPSTPTTTPPSTDPSAPPTTDPSTPPSTTPPTTDPSTPPGGGGNTVPPSGSGQTWYVNGGGGTRYSANNPSGQCNGMSPNAYPGNGVNQNCAFKDIRSLWTDGSYTIDPHAGAPAWGWIGSSGDTYIIDCTGGALCRIGQNGPNVGDWVGGGLAGDPYESGMPAPINGTPGAHTRILGANYQSCTSSAAKAHINGGYGVATVLTLEGSSYVDVACFDITDFSNCGKSGQLNTCHVPFPVDDFATHGIRTNPATNNTTITDVSIHGMADAGMVGPTGDNVSLTRVSLIGNPSSGWNMDDGSGTTGSGRLNLSYVTVAWNGCAEEYPIVDALPYNDCTDDQSNGYGDGIGTATVPSNPGWVISVDHSTAAYNTQDGFDFLHVNGSGSSVSITNTLGYGNMGQQIKLGAISTATNNLIVGNCNALRYSIPGAPSGYNARLSDFCRAADTAAVISVGDSAVSKFINNTVYTAGTVALEVSTAGTCTSNCFMQYDNNLFVGFAKTPDNGYPSGGDGRYPDPIYFDDHPVLGAAGSSFSNNLYWNARDTWNCPYTSWNEQNAICADPGLVDETFHLYGYGNMSPAAPSSIVVGKGLSLSGITSDILNGTRSTSNPTIGAYETTTNSLSLP